MIEVVVEPMVALRQKELVECLVEIEDIQDIKTCSKAHLLGKR